ncbi:MAG TPA: hypothetical protein VNZ52_01905 [Candidatus Thermoplasmatota archaeon]|nr:hypothetical protein [Candidatus Thermoplasmatota archaeon]
MQLSRIPTLAPSAVARLEQAGVDTVPALLGADPADLARRTGMSVDEVRYLQETARRGWEEATEAAPARPEDPSRVVLKDDAPTARVLVAGAWHDDVPILISKGPDFDARLRETLREDGVLLRAKADTVAARVAGAWWENLPLFKERRGTDGLAAEVRVRVDEIREHRVRREETAAVTGDKRTFFQRLFGR